MIRNVFEIVQLKPYENFQKKNHPYTNSSKFLVIKICYYYLDKKLDNFLKNVIKNAKFTLGCSPFIGTSIFLFI